MRRLAGASALAAVAPWSPPAWGFDASAGRSGAFAATEAAWSTGHPDAAVRLARAADVPTAAGPAGMVAVWLAGAGALVAVAVALRPGGGSGRRRGAPASRAQAPRPTSPPTSPGLATILRLRRVWRPVRGVAR